MPNAYIVGAVRTAVGRKKGKLKNTHPADLGAFVLDALLARTDTDADVVEDVVFGCVDQVGEQAMNIARNAVLSSKLPETTPATTVDRQCGSGLQALHFAAQEVMSGTHDVVIAGGVENMTRVPIAANVIAGHKAGFGIPYKSAGIRERYPGVSFNQFAGAEMIAKRWDLSREDLDAFGLSSHQKAAKATHEGHFKREILPVDVKDDDGNVSTFDQDEGIRYDTSLEALASLDALAEGGRLTAGTSSQISDGAAALLVANEDGLKKLGAEPRARFHTMTLAATDPIIMLTGPIPATKKLVEKSGVAMKDIDLYEVNEAFASVPLAWSKEVDADLDKLNVNGGAIALGHPLGCTGAKLTTTLIHELERRDARYGLVTICEGGGLANATLFERA